MSGRDGGAAVTVAADALRVGPADQQLRRAAAVLRLLYLEDLRELQTQVNTLLATAQEFTANPKTDSALGSVGRSH